MAGNSFIVTVSAPNTPCAHTHTRVTSGQPGPTTAPAPFALPRPRRHCHQVAASSTMINTPTPVAR